MCNCCYLYVNWKNFFMQRKQNIQTWHVYIHTVGTSSVASDPHSCSVFRMWYTFHRIKCRFSVDWMMTEWRLNGNGKGGFQSHFSIRNHSVDWMAGTFQWPFSQLIFEKLNYAQRGANPGCLNQGSVLGTSTVFTTINRCLKELFHGF